jgi:hypothetical protein
MDAIDFLVYVGEKLIGEAKGATDDMPNIIARFEPTAAFEDVRHLFEREYALIKGAPSEWTKIKNDIFSLGLRLERKDTGETLKATPRAMPGSVFRGEIAYLHIHESKIWWRYL